MTYRIAHRLTDEAKQAMVAANYKPLYRRKLRRTDEGYCPLGLGLRAMGLKPEVLAPGCCSVAHALSTTSPFDAVRWESIDEEAGEFIDAWDAGEIDDLAAALGVGGGS